MSYAIVRMQKFSAGSVMGVQIHDRREKNGVSHTNKDIDWTKTELNYDIAQTSQTGKQKSFHQITQDRIKTLNLKKAVRKDAVVLAQCLVTSEHDFFENMTSGQTRQFFEDSFVWLCDRYGKENVVSSTVHMDERTPHMHFNFVPVTPDGRLSAKSVLTRQSLIEQQDLFVLEVGRKYDLERGEKGGKKTHLDVLEYKLKTKNQELKTTEKLIQALKKELINIQTAISPLEEKKEALEQQLKILGTKSLEVGKIQSIMPKKGFGGGLKDISMEDFQSLKQMAMDYVFTKRDLDTLQKEHEEIKKSARISLNKLTKLNTLESKNVELESTVKSMNRIINSNPELKELYMSEIGKVTRKTISAPTRTQL